MRVFGLLGEHISYSFSPQIHHLIFKELGFEGSYQIVDVSKEQFTRALLRERFKGFHGFNVTIPYKEAIIPFLDELRGAAMTVQAVNTVKIENDKWIGYNTDYDGFAHLIKGKPCCDIKRALVLGTGGASKVVKKVLEDFGYTHIDVVSRQPKLKELTYSGLEQHVDKRQPTLLVNCTPLGSKQHEGVNLVSRETVSRCHHVIDLVYTPAETALLKLAGEEGISCENGLSMLLVQALAAEELWWDCVIHYEPLIERLNTLLDK